MIQSGLKSIPNFIRVGLFVNKCENEKRSPTRRDNIIIPTFSLRKETGHNILFLQVDDQKNHSKIFFFFNSASGSFISSGKSKRFCDWYTRLLITETAQNLRPSYQLGLLTCCCFYCCTHLAGFQFVFCKLVPKSDTQYFKIVLYHFSCIGPQNLCNFA